MGWKKSVDSYDDELFDQLPLFYQHGVTCADGKRHNEQGEFTAELACFKKLQIDVQVKKLRNLEEELYKMKNFNGGLMGTSGCDAILCPRNTLSAKGRRENSDEECPPCPDGDSSKHLGSDHCEPNDATDD